MESYADISDCMTKLEIMIERGGRGRALTIGEIEHASVSYPLRSLI